MNELALKCSLFSEKISDYIAAWITQNSSFRLRTFYAETFSLSLLHKHNRLTPEIRQILRNEYNIKNKNDPEFHFEFNNYALTDYLKRSNDLEFHQFLFPLKFKNTPCTNWTLLRSVVRILNGVEIDLALNEAQKKIQIFQMKNGLILDDAQVKSFQYHCFSAAMIYEIFLKTKDLFFKKAFLKSTHFIRHFIMPNGDTLYIGRGQEQSFGMGVLIYILALDYKETNDSSVLGDLQKVISFLEANKKANGTFPLVFNGIEPEIPENYNPMDERFYGWYPYNNYFDYLSFLGLFLSKSFDILKEMNISISRQKLAENYRDSSFIIINKLNYRAVLSLPGGYWTNDLPFPLVFHRDRFQTPMLGGEQFQKSLYNITDLSMPLTKVKNISWRKFGKGFFFKNSLIWVSVFGILIRHYSFSKDYIRVTNYSICFIPSVQSISFYSDLIFLNTLEAKTRNVFIKFSRAPLKKTKGHSPVGALMNVFLPMNHDITMRFDL